MGLIVGIVVAALTFTCVKFLGVTAVALSICGVAVAIGLGIVWKYGHRGFGGRGNTDLTLYLAVVGVALAIGLPQFTTQ